MDSLSRALSNSISEEAKSIRQTENSIHTSHPFSCSILFAVTSGKKASFWFFSAAKRVLSLAALRVGILVLILRFCF